MPLSLTPRRIALTLRTVAHLRPSQVAWRIVRRWQRGVSAVGRPPQFRAAAAAVGAELIAQLDSGPRDPEYRRRAERFVKGEFEALGVSMPVASVDWGSRPHSHLWTYHLHYFELIPEILALHRAGNADALPALLASVDAWIEATDDGRGDGWDPYPTSIRVVHWLRLLLVAARDIPADRRRRIESSVVRQLRHLRSRLEWHILGNHLIKNLTALVWGGVIIDGPEASRWRTDGLAWLERELASQVLVDGTHEERSPAYHLVALRDLLETIALLRAAAYPVPAAFVAAAKRMRAAGAHLIRADGTLRLLGDSPNGMGASWGEVSGLADRVLGGIPPADERAWALPDAGYWGASRGSARVIIDCGPIGPDHQPGHGHCDLLSFELELDSRPVIVDSGVHGYAGDPFREYSRSTRAHNTVMIDGAEQSEVWGTFRVARRAIPEAPTAHAGTSEYLFTGAYRPFHRPHARHHREIALRVHSLRVTDRVEGANGAALTSYLHLHPDWLVELEGRLASLRNGERVLRLEWFGVDGVSVVSGAMDGIQGWYLPAMGEAHAAPTLVARIANNRGLPFGFELDFGT